MQPLDLPRNLAETENRKLRREFTQRFSERLKSLRKATGLTQQQLAEAAGLHLTYIGHLELGKYHPTLFVVWKIAKALGVSLDDLAGN